MNNKHYPNIENWHENELIDIWNHLESLRLTLVVEEQMEEIYQEQARRKNRQEMEYEN